MSKEIWTVINYKPKDDCEEKFIEGLKRLGQMIDKSKAGEKFKIPLSKSITESMCKFSKCLI